LADDLRDSEAWLKLMLQGEPPMNSRDPAVLRRRIALELPPSYFPRLFVISDAAITNSASAWLQKHFYL
jgi:hypothetical protein